MALLNEEIPVQQFELVRDRIAEILKLEMDNQFALFANPDLKDVKVYTERFVPFAHNDLTTINVRYVNGAYEIVTVVQSDGTYEFFIDVYTNSKTTTTEDADPAALKKLQRVIGVVRAILENGQYTTLGWARPSIEHTAIKSIDIADPKNNQDAAANMFGRITFTVRVPETTQLIEAQPIDGFNSTVTLGLTDKGYLWSSGGFEPNNLDPLHIWDSEHIVNVGTTVMTDFNNIQGGLIHTLSSYFLSFGVAICPPTICPYFNGFNSMLFNASGQGSLVLKSVLDFRASDTKGQFMALIRTPTVWQSSGEHIISTSKSTSDTHYSTFYVDNGILKFDIHDGTSLQSISAGGALSLDTNYIVLVKPNDNADGYVMNINGVDQVISGADNGKWMAGIAAGRNTLCIGGVLKTTFETYGGQMVVILYADENVDTEDLINVTNAKYNIF